MQGISACTVSTDLVSARKRDAFWREVVCRTLVELDCTPLGPQPLRGSLEDIAAGENHLCRVVATAQQVRRGAELIARSREAYVVVCLQHAGACWLSQDGRETTLTPGALAVVDSERPYALRFEQPFSQFVLRIPQQRLTEHIGRTERYTAIQVSPDEDLAKLFRQFVRGLRPVLGRASPSTRERLFATATELLAAALVGRRDPTAALSQHRLALLCRVRQYCELRLGDEALSPAGIARANGVSTRYLHQLFEAEGESLMHWIWRRRLQRCRLQLADPALARRTIGEIAYANGFSDLAHFSRRFREEYRESPGEYRRSAKLHIKLD